MTNDSTPSQSLSSPPGLGDDRTALRGSARPTQEALLSALGAGSDARGGMGRVLEAEDLCWPATSR